VRLRELAKRVEQIAQSGGDTSASGPEAPRIIGAAGQPAWQNEFMAQYGNVDEIPDTPTGFYKDRGRVYLFGVAIQPAAGAFLENVPMFQLPDGYRPDHEVDISVVLRSMSSPWGWVLGRLSVLGEVGNTGDGYVQISEISGSGLEASGAEVHFDGISFLAR
jgi:hypothetical protein